MRIASATSTVNAGDLLDSSRAASFAQAESLSSWRLRTAVLIGGATLVRLFIISTVGLTDTEAYYYAWSRFPSLSYYDHPPMIAWTIWLTTLVSKSPFTIRLGSVVCAAILGALSYRLAERLFSPRAGYFTVLILTILPAFTVTSFVANPESLHAPLWVLNLLLLHDLSRHREPWRPIALGFAIGLAFLCKYTSILILPITLLYIAMSPIGRSWFRRPVFYLGGLVALLTVAPVIVWNYQHHWPTLQLHFVERMSQPGTATFAERAIHFLTGQVFFFHPLVFPGLMAMLVYTLYRARRDRRFRLLALASAPVLLFFFVVMSLVRDAESHWPMVSYIAIAIAAAGWLDERWERAPRVLSSYLRACLATSAILATIFLLHAETPELLHQIPDSLYNAHLDVVNETVGWADVASAIAERSQQLGSPPTTSSSGVSGSTSRGAVASSHNVLCGRLLMEVADHPPVYCPSPTRTEFDFVNRRLPPPDEPVIYVDSERYPGEISQSLPGRQCDRTDEVEVKRGGRVVNRYRISVCGPHESRMSDPDHSAPEVSDIHRSPFRTD